MTRHSLNPLPRASTLHSFDAIRDRGRLARSHSRLDITAVQLGHGNNQQTRLDHQDRRHSLITAVKPCYNSKSSSRPENRGKAVCRAVLRSTQASRKPARTRQLVHNSRPKPQALAPLTRPRPAAARSASTRNHPRTPLADITPLSSTDERPHNLGKPDPGAMAQQVPTESPRLSPDLPQAIDLLTAHEARWLLLLSARSDTSLANVIQEIACHRARDARDARHSQKVETAYPSYLADTFGQSQVAAGV